MTKEKLIASFLIFGQFGLLLILFIRNQLFSYNLLGVIVQLFFILVLIFAVVSMKMRNLRISPLVKENSELAIVGPYKFIRHPMYTSVLGYMLPIVLAKIDVLNSILYISLLALLIVKLYFEESLLLKKFELYEEYKRRTWRLIPYIF